MNKLILAGNPNTGKTTLFNTLTGSNEHAGNWNGVTVSVKEKPLKKNKDIVVCDLPGLYSLDGFSEEEKLASKFIDQNQDAVVVCIVDANNLRRNLFLAYEIYEKNKNMIIAVNMAKEKSFDSQKLQDELQIKVVKIDARKRKNLSVLLSEIQSLMSKKTNPKSNVQQNREITIEQFDLKCKRQFEKIDKVLQSASYNLEGTYGYCKLDKILLNPIIGFLFFALVMAAVFFITFGAVGSAMSDIVAGGFQWLTARIIGPLRGFASEPFVKFIEEGVLGGALTVLSFMPQILLLFFCLNFLEDIGYLSRVALMFDGAFKKIGLTGRSVFSLIMGFGCTTTAVTTTRGLDNEGLKKRTALLLPFMSCSAKLPIYAVICAAFFRFKALVIFLIYMLGVLLMLLVSVILKKFDKTKDTFMLELPRYRMPNLSKIANNALKSAVDFLIRVGGVLLLSSIVVFLLYNYSFDFKFVSGGENSILATLAEWLKFIFIPLGFGSAGAVIAILTGLIAKEMVVSSLAIVNGVMALSLAQSLTMVTSPVHFTTLSAISFVVFVLLYPTCISAFFSMKREVGAKNAFLSFAIQFVTAYVTSALIYGLGKLALAGFWWLVLVLVIVLAICLTLVVKCLLRKRQSLTLSTISLRCKGCKEKCNGNNIL